MSRQVGGLLFLISTMDHRISSLTLQKRNRQRVNIFLDGEFAFSLSRIVAAWLQNGMILSDERIASLKAEDELESAYQRALHWISYRPRTEAEILRNLQRGSVPDHVIVQVIERLKASGLVDDANFAENWIENRSELRPRSQKALAFELKRMGVDSEIIDQAVSVVDDTELALQAAQRQARKIRTTEWREFRQKMLRHLAMRGFGYEESSEAIRQVWQERNTNGSVRNERAT